MVSIPYNWQANAGGAAQNAEAQAKRGSDIQEVSITDLISEGPIEGLVKGEASVYLEGDQLSDVERITKESLKAENTAEPHTISFAAASSNNQPVTASMKDRAGNTAYYNDLAETYGDAYTYRWLTVFGVNSSKIKVEFIRTQRNASSTVTTMGDIRICAVGSTTPFNEDTFFVQSYKPPVTYQSAILHNLKPVCRVVLPSGQIIRGSITGLFGDNFSSAVTSGSAKRAIVRPWVSTVNAVNSEQDIFVNGTNEVYGEVFIDRVWRADIRTVSGNNVIYIPKHSNSLAITDKTFSIGEEQKINGGANQGGNPNNTQKYPGSSVQFRVGSRSQEPFTQIAGVGVASFPVTLSSSQLETFDSTADYPTTIPAGYPDIDPLPTGMVQKNIVFSQSFTNAQINEIDRIKIQFEFPQGHYSMNEEGDEGPSGAAFHIELQGSESGGANPTDWTSIDGGEFTYKYFWGKQKTAIAYPVEIPVVTNLNVQDMRLQITRITPDGASWDHNGRAGMLRGGHLVRSDWDDIEINVDSCKISQVIATIDEKLEYPYSAMAAVRFSSKSFPNPPKRAYHVRGLKVKIPSNYTPRHLTTTGVATYTGIWNGEFSDEGTSNSSGLDVKTYYTDNPAWVFYDMLTNNRYGLGAFLKSTDINKFQLYKIAKYCDELVPGVNGTTEPRFTANLYLTKATEAYKVLKDMATIFRGILYWLDGEMVAVSDMPATPIYNFSESNILSDSISIQNTGSKSRANQYTIIWNNPLNSYKQEPLVLEDRKNIVDTGRIIPQKAVAFGCTSEGQAIRYGRWKAWTAINQTELISFKTSINAAFLVPGDVINVQDQSSTGTVFSGRITASSNSAITLDQNIVSASTGAQAEGGNTQSFSFGSGSDYAYSLAVLVTDRKVVLTQDTPASVTYGGSTYTYNRGDIVTYAKIAGTATALIGTSDSDEQVLKNISNIQDNDGNDMQVEFRNSTNIETRSFTSSDVSVVNGVTQIAIGSPFVGTIPSSTVWAIKEQYKGLTTNASYKEYKILGLKEDKDNNWEISAVEFSNSKFDAVDSDFTLAVTDSVTPPEPAYVPRPESVYILQQALHKSQLNELQVMWEPPRNSDDTDYEFVSSYAIHVEPRLPDGTDLIEINNTNRRLYRFRGVPDGLHNFGVQVFSLDGKRSEIVWRSIDLRDPFKVSCDRTIEGVPAGININTKMSKSGSTWSLDTKDWGIQSPGAPGTKVNNANQNTAATHQQDLTAMASGSGITRAFIYFDADATTDYFKLATVGIATWENTRSNYWRDYTQYVAAAENDWVDCTGNADVRVTIPKYSNKVVRSEGSATFLTTFKIGDLIRIKYDTNKYVGGKVAYIEDDNTLYVDRRLNGTNATLTSVDEAKAIARPALRIDTANDCVCALITLSGGTYTHYHYKTWNEDLTLTGLRALIVDLDVSFLNYNSAEALQNEATITLTADALSYSDPEFTITGSGFTSGSPAVSGSAQSSYIDSSNNAVTNQTLTWQIHDGSGGIGYNSGASLDFTVAVRESTDQSEARSKTIKIVKVKDGSIGLDGKTVVLTSDDYSIIYDEQGVNPSYNHTTQNGSNNIIITATANNFTDPIYRFTFDGTVGTWTDTTNTEAATYVYTAAAIPTPYDKTHWPKVVKVEVGEKHSGWSAGDTPSGGVVSTDSISIIGVKVGSDGVSLINSNSSHNYTTDVNGKIGGATVASIPASGTTLELIVGGAVYTYIGGTGAYNNPTGTLDNGEWYISSATVVGSDLTIGTPSSVSSNVVTIGTHSTTGNEEDTETVTYTITYKQAGTTNTLETVQTLSKSKQGATGATPDAVPGDDAPRNITGYLYWIGSAGTTPGNSDKPGSTSYNFNTTLANTSFTPALATGSNNSANWSISPPVASDSRTTTFYMPFSSTETLSSGSQTGSGTVSFGSIAQGISFTGLVTFSALATDLASGGTNNITTIDGGKITTGLIKANGTTGTDLSTGTAFTTNGSYFNLDNGAISTKGFRIDNNGNAEFKGSIQGSGGHIGASNAAGWRIVGNNLLGGGHSDSFDTTPGWPNANITLDAANKRIIIRETTNATTGVNRVILGKLS